MFKTTASILFIVLSIFMQYARQFAYIGCRIENINSKTTCDCEKKNDNDVNKEGQTIPVQKNQLHNYTDDFCITGVNSASSEKLNSAFPFFKQEYTLFFFLQWRCFPSTGNVNKILLLTCNVDHCHACIHYDKE